jgi:hypothetical protein
MMNFVIISSKRYTIKLFSNLNNDIYKPLYCLIGDKKNIPKKIFKELKKNNNYIHFNAVDFAGDKKISKVVEKNGYAFYREMSLLKNENKIIEIIKGDNAFFNKNFN